MVGKKRPGKIKEFSSKYPGLLFIIVLFLTIVITRIGVLIYDANPIILNFELHHFDYGILILLVVSLFLLFGRKKYVIYHILTAIAFGLILDQLWFIRRNVLEPVASIGTFLHNNTLPSVIILTFIVTFIILLINYLRKKKKLK